MRPAIVTFVVAGGDPSLPILQAANVKKMAPSVPHLQLEVPNEGGTIGHWRNIDRVMYERTDYDVLLFVEWDTAILKPAAVATVLTMASCGVLAGCVTCANHLRGKYAVAGPHFTAVPRKQWEAVGRPSAVHHDWLDTMGQYTMAFRGAGLPVFLSYPKSCGQPIWELPDGTKFGPDTIYDIGVYHKFGHGSLELLQTLLRTSLPKPTLTA